MSTHVLVVSANLRDGETLKSALRCKKPGSIPTTVNCVANLDGALSEVEATRPRYIVARQSFFTHASRPSKDAWLQLLARLRESNYHGTVGVIARNGSVDGAEPPAIGPVTRSDGITVILVDPLLLKL